MLLRLAVVRSAALAPLLLLATGCSSPEPTGRIEEEPFDSTAADETFTILVRVPPDYDDDETATFPVIYQLDGTFLDQFERTAVTLSDLAEAGDVPEAIVVGIGHLPNDDPEKSRMGDFVPADPGDSAKTGRASAFYAFLRDELIPHVESAYRVDPTRGRTLVGHSLGGLFALYAFFQVEPDGGALFDRVLAADPSYGENDGVIYTIEESRAALGSARPGRLFLTASKYTGAIQKFSHEEMERRIEADFSELSFEATYEETDHGGLIQRSLDVGLPFLLEER